MQRFRSKLYRDAKIILEASEIWRFVWAFENGTISLLDRVLHENKEHLRILDETKTSVNHKPFILD